MYNEGHVYMYKGKIPIPALAMVDDVATVAICNSIEALNSNIVTDSFIQRKKLEGQTGAGKCQWVHIGSDECQACYKINKQKISKADVYKYLGDHVSDGWENLYNKRTEKALGYSAMCLAMSTEISLGIGMYEMAKLFHLSIFVNGTLLNMETWPKCTEVRISKLEKVEQNFMRRILKAHSKTPIEALYLELGIVPLRFHLMKRRILYLNDILNREDGELTKQVVKIQMERSSNGDFYELAAANQEELNISHEALTGSKEKLKAEVVKNMNERAYQFLMEKARKHSKIREDVYVNCDGFDHYKGS